jgi:exodeoxyribonuclease VII large subunit
VRDADGLPVRSADAAARAARFQLQFADGALFARPEEAPDDPVAPPLVEAPRSAPRPKRAPRRAAPEPAPKPEKAAAEPAARQGSLF